MASVIPNSTKGRLLGDNSQISSAIDLEADTLKLMLLTSSHSNDIDTQVFIDDVSTNEIGNSGTYSAGGGTMTVTSSTDDTGNEGVFDASDVAFTSSTITARYAVIYKDSGTPATSPIICIIDFGTDQSSSAGTFTISFAIEGIINLG